MDAGRVASWRCVGTIRGDNGRRPGVNSQSAALGAGQPLGQTLNGPAADAAPSAETVAPAAPLHEDVVLVHRTLRGDHDAFAELVAKYKDPVFNVAYRMLG